MNTKTGMGWRVKKAPGLLAAVMLGSSFPAFGALMLTIDVYSETFTFSGSDTGTPFAAGTNQGIFEWVIAGSGFDYTVAIDDAAIEVGAPNSYTGSQSAVHVTPNSIEVVLHVSNPSELTVLTGTGTPISYSAWSDQDAQAQKAYLRTLDGSTIPRFLGSSEISAINVSVVPEPTTAILASLGLTGLLGLRRRA